MDKSDRHDESLEQHFTNSRRVDRETLPDYAAVRHAEPKTTRAPNPRRLFVLGLSTAAATAAVAAVAFLVVQPVREQAPITIAKHMPLRVAEPLDGSGTTALDPSGQVVQFSDRFVQDPPIESRFHQTALTVAAGAADPSAAHGSRSRNVKLVVSSVSNVQAPGYLAPEQQFVHDAEPNSTEGYDLIEERDFVNTLDEGLSTFSIDVDTASYANVRRFLSMGRLPPRDAVRIEEMINYFDYDYPEPTGAEPFSTTVDVAGCPWNASHRLVRVGIRGREGGREDSRGSNLVFLIDVSGSMKRANKLPLLKDAFGLLTDQLTGRDQVAIVVYAGNSGLVLPSTAGSDRGTIREAIQRLEAGGSTNGGAGIELAYKTALENFIPGGVNRIVLATDGDFNVGTTDRGGLLERVQRGATDGIALTALGFGMGNYKDGMLETLADKGDGNYFYIDTEREARKVLVEELQGTLVTIAKDVKIQVEFNPAEVEAYRLIGYENRRLAKQDFNDDTKDAGEIGSGHTVTALYEIVPAGSGTTPSRVDAPKYRRQTTLSREADSGELLTVKLRYKEPEESKSRLLEFPVHDPGLNFDKAPDDFRFAASVAAFGMVLRDSKHRGTADLDAVHEILTRGLGPDKSGYRAEFHALVQQARTVD